MSHGVHFALVWILHLAKINMKRYHSVPKKELFLEELWTGVTVHIECSWPRSQFGLLLLDWKIGMKLYGLEVANFTRDSLPHAVWRPIGDDLEYRVMREEDEPNSERVTAALQARDLCIELRSRTQELLTWRVDLSVSEDSEVDFHREILEVTVDTRNRQWLRP